MRRYYRDKGMRWARRYDRSTLAGLVLGAVTCAGAGVLMASALLMT